MNFLKTITFVFSILTISNIASADLALEGTWALKARKCADAPDWEPIKEIPTRLIVRSDKYELLSKGGNCTLKKVGDLRIAGNILTLCFGDAMTEGNCEPRLVEHVERIKQVSVGSCSSRTYRLSANRRQLFYSEATVNPGFACAVGVDLEYRLDKVK